MIFLFCVGFYVRNDSWGKLQNPVFMRVCGKCKTEISWKNKKRPVRFSGLTTYRYLPGMLFVDNPDTDSTMRQRHIQFALMNSVRKRDCHNISMPALKIVTAAIQFRNNPPLCFNPAYGWWWWTLRTIYFERSHYLWSFLLMPARIKLFEYLPVHFHW